MHARSVFLVAIAIASAPIQSQAKISVDWAFVGDAGNTGELTGAGTGPGGWGPVHTVGAVAYDYYIAKHEVTNAQYIQFLNSVASVSDPNGLYSSDMGGAYGGINRTGIAGDYHYSPKDGNSAWLNRPVNYVHWFDALRFVNWMDNGCPTGLQDALTTEDGAYDMSLGVVATRKPGAEVFLANENEWYKAAYYKGGGSDAGYWDYATQSDVVPNNNPPFSDTGNSSNWYDGDYAVGYPYYSSLVGAYQMSPSAYGTFDQSGNMCEWTETRVGGDIFIRGGSMFGNAGPAANSHWRNPEHPDYEYSNMGFRIASTIPEPSMSILLGMGAIVFLRRQSSCDR